MKIPLDELKNILVPPGHISGEDFDAAEKEAIRKKLEIEEVLIDKDLIKDEQLGQLIAQNRGFDFVNLRRENIGGQVLDLIPEVVAKTKKLILFFASESEIKVGMTDPGDLEMINTLNKRFARPVKAYLITENDFSEAMLFYRHSLSEEINKILKKLESGENKKEKDKLMVSIVDLLLEHGCNNKASDIHVEPQAEKIIIRFRIDGVMHNVFEAPKWLNDLILTRIKVISKMRIDEHAAAQDGKFQLKTKRETVDVRVSVVPVTNGENIVMRLLSSSSREMSLDGLGFSGHDLEKIRKALQNPQGMILVTGPTGSGKTTTLYEILKILNRSEVNIATVEDPVEYNIEGISQIQVNPRTNLTFAKGLRAIVRQDPDIIMVGEIRDNETVEIAVNSAMTGHLVLSTMHANDAATALPRLMDMGIEPYLIVSTVRVIVGQRLLRKICEKCRYSYVLSKEEISLISARPRLKEIIEEKSRRSMEKVLLYKGKGCKVCSNTGYRGRIGVFEILEMLAPVKELVAERAASGEIVKTAENSGMTTLLKDGVEKSLSGQTTLEEILRVIGDPE